MDAHQFDRVTQQLGQGLSRRRLGETMAAFGIGAVVNAPRAAAKKRKKPSCSKKQKQRCRREGRACDKGKCVIVCDARNSACRGNQIIQLCGGGGAFCDCSPLVQGGFACAATRPETCPAASECDRDSQCAAGEVCVDVSDDICCGGQEFGLCLRQCREVNPGS